MHFLVAFALRPQLFSQLKTRQVADEDTEVVLNLLSRGQAVYLHYTASRFFLHSLFCLFDSVLLYLLVSFHSWTGSLRVI